MITQSVHTAFLGTPYAYVFCFTGSRLSVLAVGWTEFPGAFCFVFCLLLASKSCSQALALSSSHAMESTSSPSALLSLVSAERESWLSHHTQKPLFKFNRTQLKRAQKNRWGGILWLYFLHHVIATSKNIQESEKKQSMLNAVNPKSQRYEGRYILPYTLHFLIAVFIRP
jgi:hypothetical protein